MTTFGAVREREEVIAETEGCGPSRREGRQGEGRQYVNVVKLREAEAMRKLHVCLSACLLAHPCIHAVLNSNGHGPVLYLGNCRYYTVYSTLNPLYLIKVTPLATIREIVPESARKQIETRADEHIKIL